jgi:GGDEF domain-containing protein
MSLVGRGTALFVGVLSLAMKESYKNERSAMNTVAEADRSASGIVQIEAGNFDEKLALGIPSGNLYGWGGDVVCRIIEVDRLDHFRAACGPGVIPTILRVIAQTIENSLRPTDMVGSWSERLFLAILPDCGEAELAKVGNRIRRMICQSEIEWWGDKLSVTAAFGGAGCRAEDTPELLLDRANKSLSESIVAGGNQVTVVT